VKVWDAATGEQALTLKGSLGTTMDLAFNPDGHRVASAGNSALRVWDAVTGRETLSIKDDSGVSCVAFSPDGRKVILGSYFKRRLNVLDAATGDETVTLIGQMGSFISVAFSPNGRRIVSGGFGDRGVKVWDAATGVETLTLEASGVAAFSPDGRRIVSGSNTRLNVWDAGPEKVLADPKRPKGKKQTP
jgi:WD40 repeat protein